MARFEKVKRFENSDIQLPTRATNKSAGWDMYVAEDIVLPPFDFYQAKIRDAMFESKRHEDYYGFLKPMTLEEIAAATSDLKCKIPLVSTGVKCELADNEYLELAMRSSTPLKHWIIMGNSVGR